MATPTHLLIRWKFGYTEVGAPVTEGVAWGDGTWGVGTWGVAEASRYGYLSLGSVETEVEAKRIGNRELARISGVRDQISLGADPNPANPANAVHTGWDLGDYVITRNRQGTTSPARVLQISFDEDQDETLAVLPDLSTLLEQREIRTQRWLTRMAGGTLNGSSSVASPIVTPEHVPGRRPGMTVQTFSWNPITTIRTSPWTPEVKGRLAQMHLKRGRSNPPAASDIAGNCVVAFIVNGVTLDEGTIWDGYEEGTFGGTGVEFGPADKLELEVTTVNGINLTARVIQTHYH